MPPDALALIRRAKKEAKEQEAASKRDGGVVDHQPIPPLQLAARPIVPAPLLKQPCASVQYGPEFLSVEDEALLLRHILEGSAARWSAWNDNGRRTQNWGGRPGERTVQEPFPEWLQSLTDALVASGAWPVDGDDGVDDGHTGGPPNHVIINQYTPGVGLTPHTDGPLYASRVATLSLWSDAVMELHAPVESAVLCEEGTRLCRLLLRRRCLNVLSGDAYRLFHGIRQVDADVLDAETVANLAEAGGAEGERVIRDQRISIVFVRKLGV